MVRAIKKYAIILASVGIGFILQGYKPVGPVNQKFKTVHEKRKLFKDVNCQYSHTLEIAYPQIDQLSAKDSDLYRLDNNYYDNHAKRYARQMEAQHHAPMYLKWISNVVGYGIFAAHDIKKGDLIGEYSGVLRAIKESGDNLDYAWYYTFDAPDGVKLVVDGKDKGNELRFINHADHPNTRRVDVLCKDNRFHLAYIADRDIPKDTELTVSYGDGYFTSRNMKIVSL